MAAKNSTGKIQLVSFDQSNNSVVIDLKMNKSNRDEKSSNYARVVFLLEIALTVFLLQKLPLRKLEL